MVETNYAVATGEWLQEWQEDNNVSTSELATRLNMSIDNTEAILIGADPINEDIAEALSQITAIPKRIWINLEKRYVSDLKRLALERPTAEH